MKEAAECLGLGRTVMYRLISSGWLYPYGSADVGKESTRHHRRRNGFSLSSSRSVHVQPYGLGKDGRCPLEVCEPGRDCGYRETFW